MLMFLLFRVMQIFTGFTFTDAEDFAPLLTLLIGGICVFLIHRSKREKVSAMLFAALLLLSLWAILPNLGLFFMARELQSVSGNWPQVMVDDPKNRYGLSPQFDALFHLTNYLHAFSGAWMIIFFALFFTIQARLSLLQKRAVIALFGASMLIVIFDPGNLYAWWLD